MEEVGKIRDLPQGLVKVKGYSIEDMLDKLREVPGLIFYPQVQGRYFREHRILLPHMENFDIRDYQKFDEFFRMDSREALGYSARAYYKPSSDFDFSVLDGTISFQNGLLTEYTFIRKQDVRDPPHLGGLNIPA